MLLKSRIASCLIICCVLTLVLRGTPATAETLDGITYARVPGKVFVPVHEAARELSMPVEVDDKGHVVRINGQDIAIRKLRQLVDGTELISTDQLAAAGAEVAAPEADGTIKIGSVFRGFKLRPGAQRVEISLPNQTLYGWQGDRLVLKTRISSGRNGATPGGDFRAGPYRAAMHRSSRYNNAPMPWSVQIRGHIFVHGFTSVPNYPASHGCIRVPLTEGNPAKFFYEWVLTGTPVKVMK